MCYPVCHTAPASERVRYCRPCFSLLPAAPLTQSRVQGDLAPVATEAPAAAAAAPGTSAAAPVVSRPASIHVAGGTET